MFGWFARAECKCICDASPGASSIAPTSPAFALARSLTDPETRGEWKREYKMPGIYGGGGYITYRNAARDITVSVFNGFGAGSVDTPFTLSQDERKIVSAALDQFNRHCREVAEQGALSRLIAQGIEAAEADETGTGSAVGESPVA